MPNLLKVKLLQSIQALANLGWSQRRIAKQLGVDRKTVRRYDPRRTGEDSKSPTISPPGIEAADSKSPTNSTPGNGGEIQAPDRKPGPVSVCEVHKPAILQKLSLGLSAQRIFQELHQEAAFDGSYQAVKRYVRHLKGLEPSRVWRVEVQPGEEAQIDFGTGALIDGGAGNGCRRPWILRVVLSYSRKGYSQAILRQTTDQFLDALERAFHYFGGVPKVINLDNFKGAVTSAHWLDPQIHPKLTDFCRHYRTALMPCKVRTPTHKGKVERSIQYLKDNALKGRQFASLAEQNEFLLKWEQDIADQRIHGTTRQQVAAHFNEERPHLQPLPAQWFESFQEARRRVHRDGYIEVERAYYAVPERWIGRDVWARWDARSVRVFDERWQQLALHTRLEPGRFTQSLGQGGGQGSLERQRTYWMAQAAEMGAPCALWAQSVYEARGPIALRTVMGLVHLGRLHALGAINRACAAAVSRGATRLRDLRHLLESPEVQTHFDFISDHPLIRGLSEYGIFIRSHNPENKGQNEHENHA
jgi:transposase